MSGPVAGIARSTDPEAGPEQAGESSADRAAMLASGRRVLKVEREALALLEGALAESFADAVSLMLRARGRVVVSGMGKSGHVGAKIAATLASTGTPAQFVHPAEASHGDLGMIAQGDVVMVLSNSGETRELADIVSHTRRFQVPLIGVASRPGSSLLRAADVALVLPAAQEACPNGLAPTTSTTLTLALGDALAVALMERRAFTPERYAVFHPGGTLGARLKRVRELMATGEAVPTVSAAAPMSEALLSMSSKGYGVTGVLDDQGCLAGIITDGDLRRNMEGLLERRAGDVATPGPHTIHPDRLAAEALAQMNGRKITCLFVTERELPAPPVGLVHLHDCLRAGVDGG